MPISTSAPVDVEALFAEEMGEIKRLLAPGRRRHLDATARLRPLAILDAAIRGERLQPSMPALESIGRRVVAGASWEELFPGAASVTFSGTGDGIGVDVRLTKKEGVPVKLVSEGTPGAYVVGVKRVDELGYYNLSLTKLARLLSITPPKKRPPRSACLAWKTIPNASRT